VAPVNPWSRHGRWLAPFLGGRVGSVVFHNTIARWRFLDNLCCAEFLGTLRKFLRTPWKAIADLCSRTMASNMGTGS